MKILIHIVLLSLILTVKAAEMSVPDIVDSVINTSVIVRTQTPEDKKLNSFVGGSGVILDSKKGYIEKKEGCNGPTRWEKKGRGAEAERRNAHASRYQYQAHRKRSGKARSPSKKNWDFSGPKSQRLHSRGPQKG